MKHTLIFLAFLLIIVTGCTMQQKLTRTYVGMKWEQVQLDKGRPNRIEKQADGGQVMIYVQDKNLGKAPINTGSFQYDEFDSPAATKTETTYFYVSKDGIVERVGFERQYER